MEFTELMAERWSCRAFRPEAVEEEVLRGIFATAQQTASWCNTQPWGVHLLSGDSAQWFGKELSEHVVANASPEQQSPDLDLPAAYTGVYRERRREAGYALYESLGIERSDLGRRAEQMLLNYTFFGAPHVAIITSDRAQGTYGALDCGGYVANLMNAALDVGVASIAQGAIGMYAGAVRELLGLDDDRVVVCGVSLGRPDEEHPVNTFRTSRAALEDLVTVVERP
ncbi:nitroreductase [Nocardioides dongxiaopingii]|uniref:nitroreductase n=1 Tax=Nocardioides TaxID=1839 RepID=UPI0010C770D9|nr:MULTISPECIES: nitroreductase [Nocardioides]QCW51989.1 nitroreductase [Nocardioides sp. S-1144]